MFALLECKRHVTEIPRTTEVLQPLKIQLGEEEHWGQESCVVIILQLASCINLEMKTLNFHDSEAILAPLMEAIELCHISKYMVNFIKIWFINQNPHY